MSRKDWQTLGWIGALMVVFLAAAAFLMTLMADAIIGSLVDFELKF